MRGVRVAHYPVDAVRYSGDDVYPYRTITWTLGRSVANDRILIELNADEGGLATPYPGVRLDGDYDSVPGGDYRLRVDVLPGDTNGDGVVAPTEWQSVRRRLTTSVANPGNPPIRYTMWDDIDGSARIDARDLAEVRRRENTRLPFTQPAAVVSPVSPSRIRPITRGLFSSTPVLA